MPEIIKRQGLEMKQKNPFFAWSEQFKESHRLEEEIMKQLDVLQFNENVGNNE